MWLTIWDEVNAAKIAGHGLTKEDVESVLNGKATKWGVSRETESPTAEGYAASGIYVVIMYEQIDEFTLRVLTAFSPSKLTLTKADRDEGSRTSKRHGREDRRSKKSKRRKLKETKGGEDEISEIDPENSPE